MSVAMPRYFGLTPPGLLFGVAAACVLLAVVLAIAGRWLAALVLAAVGLALIALFVTTSRPRRGKLDRAGRVRERASWVVEEVRMRSRSSAELRRLRAQAVLLREQRDAKVRALGEAVHSDDDAAAAELRDEIRALEETAAEKEEQMHAIAHSTVRHVEEGRLSVQATMIEPPAPVPVPEPGPPPDEGTPPAPPPIPEPSPPPDEGTLPQPDPAPEQRD
jgi:hypothetical protein